MRRSCWAQRRTRSRLVPMAPDCMSRTVRRMPMAVIAFDAAEPQESKLIGLIPVGWYPGAIALDAARSDWWSPTSRGSPSSPNRMKRPASWVTTRTSIRGRSRSCRCPKTKNSARFRSGSRATCGSRGSSSRFCPPRPNQPPRAVPERIGEPSLIKHVVYIIKENRTYDQVFGALPQGNGRSGAVHFRPRDHAESSRDRRAVRAARQHLLLRHPQRGRPPVEHHGVLDRLHGEKFRRFSAELPGRHGRR